MTTYYLTDLAFTGWIHAINCNERRSERVKYVEDVRDIDVEDYKLIPLGVPRREINDIPQNLFMNDLECVNVLHNKVLFAKFMMEFFIGFIPETYYYSWSGEKYVEGSRKGCKMISKPAHGSAGHNVSIVYEIDENADEVVVSKYIEHMRYYTGHFIVCKGKILNRVYFYTENNDINFIKCGAIQNFTITKDLGVDDMIFDGVFARLKYSGFACADFIVEAGNVVIFEINPRPGGSFISTHEHFNEFLNDVIEKWEN